VLKCGFSIPRSSRGRTAPGWPWVFRYWADVRSKRMAPSRRSEANTRRLVRARATAPLTKKQAEIERDKFLAKLNAPDRGGGRPAGRGITGVALFGEVAAHVRRRATWAVQESDREGRRARKRSFYLDAVHRAAVGQALRLNQIQPQSGRGLAAHDLRLLVDDARRARDHEPRSSTTPRATGCGRRVSRSPASKARLGKRRYKNGSGKHPLVRGDRAGAGSRLEEPNLLIVETCIATSTRISEVLGLTVEAV
jgi:hypothetical protein